MLVGVFFSEHSV